MDTIRVQATGLRGPGLTGTQEAKVDQAIEAAEELSGITSDLNTRGVVGSGTVAEREAWTYPAGPTPRAVSGNIWQRIQDSGLIRDDVWREVGENTPLGTVAAYTGWHPGQDDADRNNMSLPKTGSLAVANVEGLADGYDAIDSLSTITIADLTASPAGASWKISGVVPDYQRVSWGGYSLKLPGTITSVVFPRTAGIAGIGAVGNSIFDSTDAPSGPSILAQRLGKTIVSAARYNSDGRQKYRVGAAPMAFTVPAGTLSTTPQQVTLINGVAPSNDINVNPASFLNTGDSNLITGVSETGRVIQGSETRNAIVSIPNAASTNYAIRLADGEPPLVLTGPVLFVPHYSEDLAGRVVYLHRQNDIFSGQPGPDGDYTNHVAKAEMRLLFRYLLSKGADPRVFPALPSADWTDRGLGEAYDIMVAWNAWVDDEFAEAVVRPFANSTVLANLQSRATTSADATDVANGYYPGTLRRDPLHPNLAGNNAIADILELDLARRPPPSLVQDGVVVSVQAVGTNPRNEDAIAPDPVTAPASRSAESEQIDEALSGVVTAGIFETTSTSKSVYLLDESGRLIVELPDPDLVAAVTALQAGASTTGIFETTDTASLIILDASGREVSRIYPTPPQGSVSSAEVVTARGAQPNLDTRLSQSLDAYGNSRRSFNASSLRQHHYRHRKLTRPTPEPIVNAWAAITDSYGQNGTRFASGLAASMFAEQGDAGGGWTGAGFATAGSPPYVLNGSQPSSLNGNIRSSLYGVAYVGNWTSTYGTVNSPDGCCSNSSTVGNRLVYRYFSGEVGANFFWIGTANGVVRCSFDNGVTWSTNIQVQGTVDDCGFADVPGSPVPAGSSLLIEVVSGDVRIAGVNWKPKAAGGFLYHKLGASGRRAQDFAGFAQNASWRAAMAALGFNTLMILHGTNDQATRSPTQFATDIQTIGDGVTLAIPGVDIFDVMPPENQLGRSTKMSDMAIAVGAVCRARGWGFFNSQQDFGPADNPTYYAALVNGGTIPLFNADKTHPEPSEGGRALEGGIYKFTHLEC